jgi:hypothetical protein
MDQTVMNFAGTAARSSAIATPTTGMTTYIGTTGTATIPQLETYTGSEWQTPYGLTQVANVSFSSASAVNLNNVFSSAYRDYRISIFTSVTFGQNLQFRFRNAGTDVTTTNYFYHSAGTDSGGSGYGTGSFANSASSYVLSQNDVASDLAATLDVFTPFATGIKRISGLVGYGTTTSQKGGQTILAVNLSTAYDGFSLFPSAGILTGSIKVYGYRNS